METITYQQDLTATLLELAKRWPTEKFVLISPQITIRTNTLRNFNPTDWDTAKQLIEAVETHNGVPGIMVSSAGHARSVGYMGSIEE